MDDILIKRREYDQMPFVVTGEGRGKRIVWWHVAIQAAALPRKVSRGKSHAISDGEKKIGWRLIAGR